jgi:hypothetical protein
MNEMELLARLREEVPHGVSPHADHLFRAALAENLESGRAGVTRPAHSLIRRGRDAIRAFGPAWRLALTAPLAAALAVGLVVGTRPAAGPAPTLTAKLLADRAATAALSGPDVGPGQWVYRRYLSRPGTRGGELWATADDQSEAMYIQGTLLTCSRPATCHPAEIGGEHFGLAWLGTSGISYADLGSLPADPRALLARLERICAARVNFAPACHPFTIIGRLFTAYLMAPALTAELFQALGDVPGVTVVKDAVDLAGRPGVAFRIPAPYGRGDEEIILNPSTYQVMGWDQLSADGPEGTVVLAQAPVSGPGVRP